MSASLTRGYAGEFLGVLGGSAAFTALALHLAETGDAALVATFSALPHAVLLVELAAGPLLDRGDPRRWLVLGALLRALVAAGFVPLLSQPGGTLLLLAFVFHAALSAEAIAWQVLLPRVAEASLARENGRLRAVQLTADGLGDLAGPLLYKAAAVLPFGLGATLLLLASGLLRALPEAPARAAEKPGEETAGLGFGPLLRDPPLRRVQLVWTASVFHSALALALLPLLALARGTPPALLGLVYLAFTAGALTGSLTAHRAPVATGIRIGVGLRIPALGLLLAPFPLNLLGALLFGTASNLAGVGLQTLRQRWAPAGLLARVQAASRVLLSGAGLAGAAAAGALGGADPAAPTRLALGLGIGLLVLVLRLSFGKGN